jgi:dsRNA-specific ribonuclease
VESEEMKISIITISYNSEKTIESTITSVINQPKNNLEYIIVDGVSTDGTLDIIEKYKDERFKVVSEKDNGISDAFNKGINLSTGDVIGIINSDDMLTENALSVVENAFEALLASIYLDTNYSLDTVSAFLMPLITDEINEASKNDISFDYKTALQQFVQASGKERLQYICIGESGPDHNKTFEVEAKLNSNVIGVGTGKTKREAEQHAAKKALELFAVK